MARNQIDRTPALFEPALETMGPDQRETLGRERLRQVVCHAAAHSPHFRERLAAAGLGPDDLRERGDLSRLPLIRKAILPDLHRKAPPFGGLATVPPAGLRRIYVSPGPIYDPEGDIPDYWRMARAFYAVGFRRGDIVQNTFAYHLTPAGFICDEALRSIGCTVIPAGVGNTETQARTLVDLPVTGYAGTGPFLLSLIEKVEEGGVSFREAASLEVALTAGAMLPESLRRTVQQKYGVRVGQAYATADVGLIAYECHLQAGMHTAHDMIVEVADPETGDAVPPGTPGEVVVTVFNPIYPLIRFGTGDLSVADDGPCPCGRTSPRLLRILGRTDEATKVRGMFVHSGQLDEVLVKFPGLGRYQAVVSRKEFDDRLTVRVEAAPEVGTAELAEALRRALREGIKLRAEVEFVGPGSIPEGSKKILDQRTWD